MDGWTLLPDHELQALNTLALPARARWLARLHTPEALPALLALPQLRGLPRRVLGGGSNLVLPEQIDALLLHPQFAGLSTHQRNAQTLEVIAEAGLGWHELVHRCVQLGWRGIENLALIPGQCGAAPIQNIGAYGMELAEHLQWVEWLELDTGRVWRMPAEQLHLAYRDSLFKQMERGSFLILRICLQLHRDSALRLDYAGIAAELDRRGIGDPQVEDVFEAVCALRRSKLPDPAIEPNVGSFFKNPLLDADSPDLQLLQARFPQLPCWPQASGQYKLSAAWLIEQAGLKGHRLGAAAVAARHALVLTNAGGARAHDIVQLAALIQRTVHRQFGVDLQIEPSLW